MNQDDEVIESLLLELIDFHTRGRSAAELALQIFRRTRTGEDDGGEDTMPASIVDEGRFVVRWSGHECRLGATVLFRLFRRLASPANKFVSVDKLLENVWGDERTEDTVRSAIRELRRKLEQAGMADLAEAIRVQPGYYGLFLDDVAPKS
jgi:DNA-binding response OmpR family regulator